MDKDPYKSDWENKIEAAREQENEMLSIEAKYPPPINKRKAEMNDTEILDVVLAMLDIGVNTDWMWNDPGDEFRQIAEDARAARRDELPGGPDGSWTKSAIEINKDKKKEG